MTHVGIGALCAGCAHLNEVDLSECYAIDDVAVYALMQHKPLAILTMAEVSDSVCVCGVSRVCVVLGAIIYPFRFSVLQCVKAMFQFENVPEFSKEKATNPNLKSLCMRHTYINDDSFEIISDICPNLKILDLRCVHSPLLAISLFSFLFVNLRSSHSILSALFRFSPPPLSSSLSLPFSLSP